MRADWSALSVGDVDRSPCDSCQGGEVVDLEGTQGARSGLRGGPEEEGQVLETLYSTLYYTRV